MLLPCAAVVFLLGGCAGEEAPVPGDAPKGAGVGAPAQAVDPQLAAAEKELEEARQAGDSGREIKALTELAYVQFGVGQKDEAIASLQQALSQSRAVRNARIEIDTLLHLGYMRGDDPEEARRDFEEALQVARKTGYSSGQAHAVYHIGNTYSVQNRYADALSFYEDARQLAESSGEVELTSNIWNTMGQVHAYRGESEEALWCYDRALKLATGPEKAATRAPILTGIGQLYRRRGELERARDLFVQATGINRQLGDSGNEAKVLNQLGGVYLDLGQKDKALKEYERALDLSRASGDHNGMAWALYSIGQVLLAQGQPKQALEKFEAARMPSVQGGKPRTKAAVLHGIGMALRELEKPAAAIKALEEALVFRREGGNRLGMAVTLLESGRAYRDQGDPDRAATRMEEALALAREVEASFVEAAALFELAKLNRDQKELQEARTRIERALAILESIRSDLPDDSLKSSFFASKRPYYELYIDILMQLEETDPGQGYAAKALQASERSRARSLLDLLTEGRREVALGIDPHLRRREADIAARLSQIQNELVDERSRKEPSEAKIAALRSQLERAEEDRQELEREISKKHRRYAEIRYPSPLGLPGIRQRLRDDTALLEYSLGEERSYLFLVTRQGLVVRSLPPARVIRDLVSRVRSGVAVRGSLSSQGYVAAARRLYQALVAPVLPHLQGKQLLLIAPDGPLHLLAFEALLTGDGGGRDYATLPYLLHDFALGYIPSASVLPLLSEPAGRIPHGEGGRKWLVAFADPDYGPDALDEKALGSPTRSAALAASIRLPRLEGTALEVQRIASLYRPEEVQIYERRQAIESNIKGNPLVANARRLHIAAHGELNEEHPALSGLWLTRDGEDDGLLRVYEIFDLKLKAELVVLSACDSALGQEVKGEGLVGLTRAFLYAGSPSLVVSLWRVDDGSAPDLMERFYEGLDDLGNKAEALRQAKLSVIREGGDRARPYHWAPFILVGDPE